jgi:hypothetical protein
MWPLDPGKFQLIFQFPIPMPGWYSVGIIKMLRILGCGLGVQTHTMEKERVNVERFAFYIMGIRQTPEI